MLSHTDALGETSTYSYNDLDQVVHYEDAQKQSITFDYSKKGVSTLNPVRMATLKGTDPFFS